MDNDLSLQMPLDLLKARSVIMASNGIAIKASLIDYRATKDAAYLEKADDTVITSLDQMIDDATNINTWATMAAELEREEFSPEECNAALNVLVNARLSLIYMQSAYNTHIRDEEDWVGSTYMEKFLEGTVLHIAAMTKILKESFNASEDPLSKYIVIGPARTGKTMFRAQNYNVNFD